MEIQQDIWLTMWHGKGLWSEIQSENCINIKNEKKMPGSRSQSQSRHCDSLMSDGADLDLYVHNSKRFHAHWHCPAKGLLPCKSVQNRKPIPQTLWQVMSNPRRQQNTIVLWITLLDIAEWIQEGAARNHTYAPNTCTKTVDHRIMQPMLYMVWTHVLSLRWLGSH